MMRLMLPIMMNWNLIFSISLESITYEAKEQRHVGQIITNKSSYLTLLPKMNKPIFYVDNKTERIMIKSRLFQFYLH